MKQREIKFRIWSIKYKIWLNHCAMIDCNGNIESYFLEIKDNGEKLGHTVSLPKEENIVQQFTGLKDGNNKEIYEGDILEWNSIKYKIQYDYASFGAIEIDDIDFEISSYSLFNINKESKIIGNVCENPDLLK